jgi:hypothetical protein
MELIMKGSKNSIDLNNRIILESCITGIKNK